MTEQGQSPTPPVKTRARGRYWLVLALVALVSGFTGAVAAKAIHHAHFFGGPMLMMGPADTEDAQDMAAWLVRRLARHMNATEEQKTKLTSIAKAAAKDLFPMREKMNASRREAIELLRQPTVNRDAIEKLRAEKVAHIETISKRLAQAVGDIAEVLTPEQRKELADDISYFSRRWHHGRH